MTRSRVGAAALLIAALATVSAFAQGPRGSGRGARTGGPGGIAGVPLAALNLTQAQQDLIQDIRQRSRQELQPLQEKLRAADEARRKATQAVPLNEGQIRLAVLAAAEIEGDIAVQEARTLNEIFSLLTPEQQAEVKKRQAEQGQRRRERPAKSQ